MQLDLPRPVLAEQVQQYEQEVIRLGGESMELSCLETDTCTTVFNYIGTPVDPAGNEVPPEVAAARVVELLKETRTVVTNLSEPDAPPPKPEPAGVVVSVDIELAGLRGEPVLLTWSMWQLGDGSRLHGDWLNRNLAYRIEPTTERDTALVDLWIPLPKAPGPYVVRMDLTAKDARIAGAESEPFE